MPKTLIDSPVRDADSVDGRYREIARQVAALQRRCHHGLCCERLLQSVLDVLAGLPLTTDEHGRASCHIANARRYITAGERGAGGYELRMLAGLISCGPP